MKKRLLSAITALFMALTWLPGTAFAAVGYDISDLFYQGDTGHLLTIDDVSFLGHPVSELSVDIEVVKSLMIENGIGEGNGLYTSNENGHVFLSGDVRDADKNWIAHMYVSQFEDTKNQIGWQYQDIRDEYASIGIGDIKTNDSLETVLRKFGFANASLIAQKMNEAAYAGYNTDKEAMEALGGWSYNSENGLHFCEGSGHTAYQTNDGKWIAGWIQLEIIFHSDDFGYYGMLEFEDDKLVVYDGHKSLKTQAPTGNVSSNDLDLPTDQLEKVTDTLSAIEAVSYLTDTMTSTQKTVPTCIDLATLYAETASAKAATKSITGNNILINANAMSDLEAISVETIGAVEAALTNGGVTTARYLSKTIVLTTEETDISIQIDPDVLTTKADKIRVETPTYAVTFRLSDLEPDLTQSLTFTAQDMGTGYAAGSSSRKATVKVGLPNGRTTNSITVSLPSDSGDTTYQAVVSTDGQATASKYNPATTTMDGKINTSGTYTVKSNEKDFTDISGKSAEMQTAIRYLASKGIISGTTATTFSPDGSINRAEIATLLVKALGKLDSTATTSFSDVTRENWFYTAAASSQRHKLINGYEDNTFRGTTNISKIQIVAVASRVLKTEMGYKDPASPASYLSKYSDAIDSWAQSEVALATKENLVVYRADGTFSGDKNMTRGDAAIIIYRLFQRIW